MKDNLSDRHHKDGFDKGMTKETAKARYENLSAEKEKESIVQGENLADIKIKQAMMEGAFDNLPGKGKPLEFNNYFDLPEHLRVGYQMLKNSGFLPEEVRLKKEMGILREKMEQCASEDEKRELMKQLTQLSQEYHFCMEYNKGFKKTFY